MTTLVFLTVIFAAFLHASWNAMVKSGADKYANMTALVLGQLVFGGACTLFVAIPTVEIIPYLVGSVVLHIGYQLFLLFSYSVGNLTHVYPIARGVAPLFVTAFSVMALSVELSTFQLLAVVLIGGGLISISITRNEHGTGNLRATQFAVITGLFIAGYSLVDGYGSREFGSALAFFSWSCIGNALVFLPIMYRLKPASVKRVVYQDKTMLFIGGGASFLAYSLVTWGFTQAPIALVTALREVSIIFALFIGVFVLKEKLSLLKIASTFLTLFGAALLKLAK